MREAQLDERETELNRPPSGFDGEAETAGTTPSNAAGTAALSPWLDKTRRQSVTT